MPYQNNTFVYRVCWDVVFDLKAYIKASHAALVSFIDISVKIYTLD